MRYDDPGLRQRLAGEYALGALRGAARARFERLMRRSPALRGLVQEWQTDLAPLAGEVRPVTPPRRVFDAIKQRIDQGSGNTRAQYPWWERLGFWRAFSATTAAVTVLALTTSLLLLRTPAPAVLNYVALLQDSTARPVVAVTAYKQP